MKILIYSMLTLTILSSCKSTEEKKQELVDFACDCAKKMKAEEVTVDYCIDTYNEMAKASGLSQEDLGIVGARVYVCIQGDEDE